MVCNAKGMRKDWDLLELMGTEKLETWMKLDLSVCGMWNCTHKEFGSSKLL